MLRELPCLLYTCDTVRSLILLINKVIGPEQQLCQYLVIDHHGFQTARNELKKITYFSLESQKGRHGSVAN